MLAECDKQRARAVEAPRRQWPRGAYDPDDDNWDDYTYNDPDDEDIAQPETRENGGPGT